MIVRIGGGARPRAGGVERVQFVAQPAVYILVHLQVSVRREVVGVGETFQERVHPGMPGGDAFHAEGVGAAGSKAVPSLPGPRAPATGPSSASPVCSGPAPSPDAGAPVAPGPVPMPSGEVPGPPETSRGPPGQDSGRSCPDAIAKP